MKKILLMGNPNVGKSAIFARLTGTKVMVSNYPGTTVEFKKGVMCLDGDCTTAFEVIDVPGVYSLEPISKAEEVAVDMLAEGDVIINVVDATNLERNLYLTLQLMEREIPMIIALNLWDETKHKGVEIDHEKLAELLGIKVVPTVGVSGEGIKELVSSLPDTAVKIKPLTDEERWVKIGKIIRETQKVTHHHHTFLERLGDLSVNPLTGIPFAAIVLAFTFGMIRLIGEGLITYAFDPLFELYTPFVYLISQYLGQGGFLHDILIGTLIDGRINYVESMGLITTGLYVPIAMVLPYIIPFYFFLSLLEDSGYLPRLAVLIDNVMHKMGLHGLAIVPLFLGLGCNVPGALATRVLETKRQRFIATTLMAICVPCAAQSAMIFGLVGRYGITGIGIVFLTLLVTMFILGFLLKTIFPGVSPEIFLEIPPYRIPYWSGLFKKVWMRIRAFIIEAVPMVLFGVLIVNILYILGIIVFIGNLMSPIVTGILGLPEAAIGALIIGFLRKDVAVGMLLPLNLTMSESIIASVVLAMYFPCIATFIIMLKELGPLDMLKSTLIMIFSALFVGGLLNLLL
ncbi:MAG: Ferrous iron transport protein B [Candidatus Syntrophoarchaeum caldarius]|uniref:Ferrous iron transport protein B n=1 Tax=Candidatus Syntropharchaeum caldarium TaxID=1838285 RepID=A0A1F2PA33_9EURY|nr:MAG: Ferrous iron transport protein B [Candidatus Syntrophoarchaeum caldarius]